MKRGLVIPCIALLMLARFASADDLKLSISAPKTQNLIDEPLIVRLEVKNTGNSDARIWQPLLGPETSGVIYEITEPGGKIYQWEPECRLDWMQTPEAAITLSPGDSYSLTQDLTYQIDGSKKRTWKSVLSHPGRFKIRVIGGKLYQDSNVLELTVSEPQGDDKLAHDMLVDEVHIYEGLDSIFPSRDCGKLWGNHWAESAYRKALTNGYSNSKYAVYARFHLANMMARDPFTSDWRRNVKKDLNEQVMLYQQVIQNGELTGLGVRSMLECGRASIRSATRLTFSNRCW